MWALYDAYKAAETPAAKEKALKALNKARVSADKQIAKAVKKALKK